MDDMLSQLKAQALAILPALIRASLILAGGLVLAQLSTRWLGKILSRTRIHNDQLLRTFFLRVLKVSIVISAALSALNELGLNVWSFAAGLGVAGIIIGFGLKDVLSNFAAGLLLLIYRPFRAGEIIEVEGSTGTVLEMTIVNMQLVTNEGVRVIMPNAKVWGAKIINYSLSERRRVELTFKVPDRAVEKAIAVVKETLAGDPRVLPDPAPAVSVNAIADKAATLGVALWTNPKDFTSAGAGLYLVIQGALRRAGVEIL